jgi:hydrogenase maturation protease
MLIIGVGNEFRGDDAAGLVAARRLRESGLVVEEHQGDMAALIGRWKGADCLIIIDAAAPGRTPGAIYRLDASTASLDRELFNTSTHGFGLAEAIEVSRALGTLPPHVLVFGIEARNLAMGIGVSAEVEAALPPLMDEVFVEIGSSFGVNRLSAIDSFAGNVNGTPKAQKGHKKHKK